MQIVELLAETREGCSLSRISEQLGIPKTSVLNHLRVLAASGHVELRERGYVLGPAALRLGAVIAASSDLLSAARAALEWLAQSTGETALLASLDAGHCQLVYVGQVEGTQPIRYSPPVGSRRPLYCTAFGRALLAHQPAQTIAACTSASVAVRLNVDTVTDPASLRRALETVRRTGIAITAGEHTRGAGAIAAGIPDREGRVSHAIGIALPADRIAPNRPAFEAAVRDAARRVSWALGRTDRT